MISDPGTSHDDDLLPNRRRPWLWVLAISMAVFLAVSIGTQVAKDLGQDVTWYAGFGQWLGGMGSLIASGVALVIATTDQQHADVQRRADRIERDQDLLREAGLVRIQLPASSAEKALTVQNHRMTKIFDIEIFLGDNKKPIRVDHYGVDEGPAAVGAWLPDQEVEAGQSAWFFAYGSAIDDAVRVAMRYTDAFGRRWEVDTNGATRKING